jgi:hypothetical protein
MYRAVPFPVKWGQHRLSASEKHDQIGPHKGTDLMKTLITCLGPSGEFSFFLVDLRVPT